MRYAWTCHCCGKQYSSLPLDYAFNAPYYWTELSALEQQSKGVLNSDFCSIRHADQSDHFVRGCLAVPLLGRPEQLVFGVWVSLSESSLRRALELWDNDPEPDEPPRFGWLSNRFPGYAETLEAALPAGEDSPRRRARAERSSSRRGAADRNQARAGGGDCRRVWPAPLEMIVEGAIAGRRQSWTEPPDSRIGQA
jgi:hypothetical protein